MDLDGRGGRPFIPRYLRGRRKFRVLWDNSGVNLEDYLLDGYQVAWEGL